ncbi:MAG: glycosyltransferase family 2 protein [Hyphomicrobiales bacterium]
MTCDVSIIIINWNLESFIEQAINSALEQDISAKEIIVVDNGSEDSSLQTIEALQSAADCPFKVIKNAKNIGLGAARNQGIDIASGHYIAFLDGDDWFTKNGLPHALDIARKHDADVCVFDHVQVFNDGTTKPNRHAELLAEGDRSHPEQRRNLLRNFNVAWNKLYKRQFLNHHELRFPTGLYEDLDITHRALILAEHCASTDEVVVNYRKDRPGSITNTLSEDHMQVLERFESLLQFADQNRALCAPYRQELFERVVRNSLTLLNGKQNRLPTDLHQEFLARVKSLLDTYDPDCSVPINNANFLVYRALRSGNLSFYNAVKRLNGLRLSRLGL